MSTFKMGFQNLFVFTLLLLICKVSRVYGQTARVEYINQPCSSPVCTVQAPPQLIVPTLIKPCVTPYDFYIQESVPSVPSFNGFNGYPNYAPSYPQPMPPIIIEDDDDNNQNQLLYFLIFALRNKRNGGSGNCGGCNGGCNGGCGCGCNCCCKCCNCCNCCNCCKCCSKCGGGCDNSGYYGGYSNNNNYGFGNSYIPYPISFPMNGPYPYSFPGFGGYPDNFFGSIEEPYQPGQGATDINLIIRTDSSCGCSK